MFLRTHFKKTKTDLATEITENTEEKQIVVHVS
jgi:hypothetical protein